MCRERGNTIYLPEVEQVVLHTTDARDLGVENEIKQFTCQK